MSPRSSIDNEKVRAESIKKILDAAFKLMAKNGYEASSISQIANEAGVSKGLIYNYFSSKEDLLRSLVKRASEEGERLVKSVITDDASETLTKLFRWYFDELRNNIEQWKLITDLTLKIDKFQFVKDTAGTKIREFVDFISMLLTTIGFPNPKEEAMLIAALMDGIGVQYLLIQKDYPLDEIEAYLINKYCKNTDN